MRAMISRYEVMGVLVSIIVGILLIVMLTLGIPIREDLLTSLKIMIVLSTAAGLVGTIAGFLEPIHGLASSIPVIDGIPAYMLQGVSLLLSFFTAWFLGSLVGLMSAFITYTVRLLIYYNNVYAYSFPQ